MPCGPSSSAAVRTNARIAALAAAYGAPNGIACTPLIDDSSTMLPGHPASTSRRATACVVTNDDCRLSSTTAAKRSGGMSVTDDQSPIGMPPTTCTSPCSGGEPVERAERLLDRVAHRWRRRPRARTAPRRRRLAAASVTASASRSTSKPSTVAPACTRAALTAVPMPPPPAPATTTVRSPTPSSTALTSHAPGRLREARHVVGRARHHCRVDGRCHRLPTRDPEHLRQSRPQAVEHPGQHLAVRPLRRSR